MHFLLRVLVLLLLVFSPCFVGCSSRSESDAESIEAADQDSDPGEVEDGEAEASEDEE